MASSSTPTDAGKEVRLVQAEKYESDEKMSMFSGFDTSCATGGVAEEMAKLEDEFGLILKRITVPLAWAPIKHSKNDWDKTQYMELVRSFEINLLRKIVIKMIKSGYANKCCQVYGDVRMNVMDKKLGMIGIETLLLTFEEVGLDDLREGTKKWVQRLKMVVESILLGEQELFELVFADTDTVKGMMCFSQASEDCVMQLLSHAKAVAATRASLEMLFSILDMFKALCAVYDQLKELFSKDESGRILCVEADEVVRALVQAIKCAFHDFELKVESQSSEMVVQNGEIHPLACYVMNYLTQVLDYSDTLNVILAKEDEEIHNSREGDDMSPLGRRLLRLLSSLENNLEEKSKLYSDDAVHFLFLMNNVSYIVQTVVDSKLEELLGESWVSTAKDLTRQHARDYIGACWNRLLVYLDVANGSDDSSTEVSISVIEERVKNFNICFEDLYEDQTGWKLADPKLREDVLNDISGKVLVAYGEFLVMFKSRLEGSQDSECLIVSCSICFKVFGFKFRNDLYLCDFLIGVVCLVFSVLY